MLLEQALEDLLRLYGCSCSGRVLVARKLIMARRDGGRAVRCSLLHGARLYDFP
jgi:hypothetical protein